MRQNYSVFYPNTEEEVFISVNPFSIDHTVELIRLQYPKAGNFEFDCGIVPGPGTNWYPLFRCSFTVDGEVYTAEWNCITGELNIRLEED